MARPWVRAATTGVLVVAAGVVAHQSGGSHPVTPVHLVVLTLLAVATVRLLQGAPGSWLRTFLVLLVGQWAVHLGLALSRVSGSGHADHAAPGPVTAAVHSHEGVRRAGSALGPTLLSAWGEGVTSLILNPAMMTAHAAAAVALAVWLTAGERAAVAVVRVLATVTNTPLPRLSGPVPTDDPLVPVWPMDRGTPATVRLARGGRRRGPPVTVGSLIVPV